MSPESKPSKTPTDEIPAADAYDIAAIRARLLEVVEQLRAYDREATRQVSRMAKTLNTLANKLDTLAQNLHPPDLHEALENVEAPYAVPSARFLAERLTEGIGLVVELLPDAEITGSLETQKKARAWLESLGILTDTG